MEGSSSGPPTVVSTAELAAQITELAGHLNAANRRWLALIAEFDRRRGWSDSLTRVACAATEQVFLSIALHGTAHHVETIVRQYRRATEAAELSRAAQQQAGRWVSWFWDDDGSLVLKARLPAESGLLLVRALEAAAADVPLPDDSRVPAASASHGPCGCADPDCRGNVSAETFQTVPLTARRADALGVIAESFLAHGAEALNGGERQQIVVRVDQAVLRSAASGRCAMDDGPAIAVDPAGAASRAGFTRPRLPLPRLHPHPVRGRSPRAALGRRWRDETVESRLAVRLPPPPGARGPRAGRAPRRRRLAFREAERRGVRVGGAAAHTAAGPGCGQPRARARDRPAHGGHPLAWRAPRPRVGDRRPGAASRARQRFRGNVRVSRAALSAAFRAAAHRRRDCRLAPLAPPPPPPCGSPDRTPPPVAARRAAAAS